MPLYTDQIGRTVSLTAIPKKIISLVPSQTELLFTLGLNDRVKGITKFCVHPAAWRRNKSIVGGTKTVHLERVQKLNPDLILANKEENTRAEVEALAASYPVWVSDISDLESALDMIGSVATMTDTLGAGQKLIKEIEYSFQNLPRLENRSTAIYLIWQDPFISVGADNFIHDMMLRAGFCNLLADQLRYPEISIGQIRELQPEYILLSSEPFPFGQKHLDKFQSLFPDIKILLVDGEMFSWYGSRIKLAAQYFRSLPPLREAGEK